MTFIEFTVLEKILGIALLKFLSIGIFKAYEEPRPVTLSLYLKKPLNGIEWLDYPAYSSDLVLDHFPCSQIPNTPSKDGKFNTTGYCKTECLVGCGDCSEDEDPPLGT